MSSASDLLTQHTAYELLTAGSMALEALALIKHPDDPGNTPESRGNMRLLITAMLFDALEQNQQPSKGDLLPFAYPCVDQDDTRDGLAWACRMLKSPEFKDALPTIREQLVTVFDHENAASMFEDLDAYNEALDGIRRIVGFGKMHADPLTRKIVQAHGPLPETPAAMNERQLNTVENQYIRSQGMGSYHDQDYLRIAREHVAPAFAAAKENPATALASEASRGRIY